jgi:hypothetical protein
MDSKKAYYDFYRTAWTGNKIFDYCSICKRMVERGFPHTCCDAAAEELRQKRIDAVNELVNKPMIDPIYPKDEECHEDCDICKGECYGPSKVKEEEGDDEKVSERTDIYVDECGGEWTLGEAVMNYANDLDDSKGTGNPFEALLYILDDSNETDLPFWTEVLKAMAGEAEDFRLGYGIRR